MKDIKIKSVQCNHKCWKDLMRKIVNFWLYNLTKECSYSSYSKEWIIFTATLVHKEVMMVMMIMMIKYANCIECYLLCGKYFSTWFILLNAHIHTHHTTPTKSYELNSMNLCIKYTRKLKITELNKLLVSIPVAWVGASVWHQYFIAYTVNQHAILST